MNDMIPEILQNPLYLVQGAPGSGKTQIAIDTALSAYKRGERVIFVTTSNTQSFDIARRISHIAPKTRVLLYHRSDLQVPNLLFDEGVHMATETNLFQEDPCIVLGNASKWAWVKEPIPHFNLMIIDDASSVRESLFMQISGLANRYLIIHGTIPIPPIIRSNTQRWAHMPIAPHHSISQSIVPQKPAQTIIDHTFRLPQDTINILYPHVFGYSINSNSEKRRIHIPSPPSPLWECITKGASLSLGLFPESNDEEIAIWIADNIRMLLSQETILEDSRMRGRLSPAKIGIVCAEHTQVLLMEKALGPLADQIIIDIHLHQNSVERALVFAFHPINGLKHPSRYSWDISQLELLTTRHRVACILVSRPLIHSRPSSNRDIYDQTDSLLDGYNAHRNLIQALSERTFIHNKQHIS